MKLLAIAVLVMLVMLAVTGRGQTNDCVITLHSDQTFEIAFVPHASLAETNVVQTNSISINCAGITTNEYAYDVKYMERMGVLTNVVNDLAASGYICRVKGHAWRDGRPGEGDGFMFADYHPGTTYRTCKICGKCEAKTEGEWK
jgi:hypothetical protein